jgi:NitT/TauT family transport system ATP-binding protein
METISKKEVSDTRVENEHFIVAEDVGKTYSTAKEELCAIKQCSFYVEQGEFFCIVGPSGCGKSTLLKIIAGLIPSTTGRIFVGGNLVKGPVHNVGMVFQSPVLLDWRNILKNVLLPAEIAGKLTKTIEERAHQLVEMVDLKGFERKRPYELSGGMQQRVSIARALLTDPELLLMDEPFGALDAMTREQLNLKLLDIWYKTKKTVLFVTHNIREACFLGQRILVMGERPSTVRALINVPFAYPRALDIAESRAFGDCEVQVRKNIGHLV